MLFEIFLAQLHKNHGFSNFDEFNEALHQTIPDSIKFKEDPIPPDSLRVYLQEIRRFPRLKAYEEIELALKIAELLELEEVRSQLSRQLNRIPLDAEWADAAKIPLPELNLRLLIGRKAKHKMVESNLRLVVSIAEKYQNRGVDLLDLIQEGNLGLIRAVEKFDCRKGNRLSTYATWCIRQKITRAIHNHSRTIRLRDKLWSTIYEVKQTTKRLSQEFGHLPKMEEIADCLEMTTAKLRLVIQSALPIISLDTRMGEDESSTFGELIEFDGETPEEQVSKSLLREDLESVLDNLTPREREVMRLRYGLDDGRENTLQEIGNIFKLSRESIRQSERKALQKLRKRTYILREYLD
ncbi:MAG: sigma-70 family RNA polymerase sigma factor [Microcoleus sp. Co-bin12]|nr:sigma-70 family RNA polymerase sigma factor [Microcoleus sp. Co-bin12]